LLYAARAARGFGDGFAAIILPAYLIEIGFDPFQIGIVATAALLGSAAMTLAIGFLAPRYGSRTLLLICAFLMVATGIAIPQFQHFVFIAAVAFVGTMNPTTGDSGIHVPLEHAMLAQGASDQDRTRVFARYSLIGALSIAAGALAAAAPDILIASGTTRIGALQAMFYVYAAFGLTGAALYSFLPRTAAQEPATKATALGPSRRTVYKLAALFSLDSFAARRRQRLLLLVERSHRLLVPGGGAPRTAFRPHQHNGLHAYPVEHLPHCRGLLAEPDHRSGIAAAAVRAVPDGRADAHLLRDGGGHAGGAGRGGERDGRSAQPRIVDQPGLERRTADHDICRLAAGDLRRAQDRL
jgi:hypothetical protein